MKHFKHLFTALLLLFSVAVNAHDFEVGGIYYKITNSTNKTVVVTYRGNSSIAYSNEYTGNVVIPESVAYNGNTYSVTGIGWMAFEYCSGLTSIEIPNSVTSIGAWAFEDCSGLTAVHISDLSAWCNIDFGDSSANPLRYAKNLYLNGELVTDLVIPGGVTKIKDYAFSGCSGLTSIVIPNSVTSIGRSAFSGCSGLTSIEIPNSVTSIGDYVFNGCSGLTSVVIGNSVTSIGVQAFCNCYVLTSVEIPNSVTSIGDLAFSGCSGLTSVVIGNSVTTIGDNAFRDCSVLTGELVIPNSVTSIGSSAFSGCSGLTSIEIPNSVTSIGDYAFNDCSGLTSIEIPNSVTSIGSSAFSGCSGLTSIVVAEGNAKYDSRENCNAIIEKETNTLVVGCKNTIIPNGVASIGNSAFSDCSGLTSVEIPNSVTSIGSSAFYYCSGLTSVVIPNSVTSIGDYAFRGCSGLTSIEIPNSVTSIGHYAFYGCSKLTSVEFNAENCTTMGESSYPVFKGCTALATVRIGENVKTIPDYAFDGCRGLTSIVIPNSVTSIGDDAFRNCSGLTSVVIPNSVTSIGEDAFNGTAWYNNQPDGVVYAGKVLYKYKGTMPENTSIIIEEGTLGIAGDAFYNCTGLTSIVIPNSVTSIGNYVFGGCSGLTSVVIPNSVTSIGDYAFRGCSGLTSIEIPNSVTSIGYSAFRHCSGLTSVVIPNSVTSIGNYAFSGCSGLTSVVIGNSVTSIAPSAFEDCSGLTSVVIGNSVTSIGDRAFRYCSGLTSIEIPNSVTSIGNSAFSGCSGLTSIVIPNSVTSIGSYAFEYCSGLKTVINLSSLTITKGLSSNGYVGYYADKVINDPNATVEGDFVFVVIDGINTLAGYIGNDTKVVLPEKYNGENYAIGAEAFRKNTSITSIEIPNSVTSIGSSAFSGCSGLTSIVVAEGNAKYDSRENCNAIIEKETNTLVAGCKNTIIPNSVTSIGNYAFYDCSALAIIVIPNSVTSIGSSAFQYCSGLKTVINYSSLKITKGSKDYGYIAYYADIVGPIPVTGISLDKETATIIEGETTTLVATIEPSNATDKTVTWASDNEEVATVENGVVTAVKAGTATITATAGDCSASCVVTVKTGLAPGINYRIKHNTTGYYMTVVSTESSNQNEGGVQIKTLDNAELNQIFILESVAENSYKIKSINGYYLSSFASWGYNATVNDSDAAIHQFTEVEERIYTLSGNLGYIGSNNNDRNGNVDGAWIYSNHGSGAQNIYWVFEPLTAEENKELVALRTAEAMSVLERSIARGKEIVSSRAAALSDDDKTSINTAVCTAENEKGNACGDVDEEIARLTALAEAIDNAVENAIYVWSIDDISNSVCYTVSTEDRGSWYSEEAHLNSTQKLGIAHDIADANQQFAFVKSPVDGKLYLYSVGQEKFVTIDNSYTSFSGTPLQSVGILDGTRSEAYPWVVAFDTAAGEKQISVSNGYNPGVITSWNSLSDSGNTVRLEIAAAFDATEALELLEGYTLTVSDATYGWATLVLGFNAAIPTDSGFEAYTIASVDGSGIELEAATGVLGANTPVIINAPAGEYCFEYTTAEATVTPSTDILKGTLVNKAITEKVYILSAVEGVVGFYVAKQTDGVFTAKAHKAYMVLPSENAVSFYGFRDEETTAVEALTEQGTENLIYDLSGRRVLVPEKGVYIVNGKKQVVK